MYLYLPSIKSTTTALQKPVSTQPNMPTDLVIYFVPLITRAQVPVINVDQPREVGIHATSNRADPLYVRRLTRQMHLRMQLAP